ncbi:glycosyltransferase family 9 protein [Telmatospirillum siberiense]|uniref:ADP-heptose--LPS heptosyltransferase n=1 Tax=Telmatospirillum siberiense TaxID=382514 RepID=A0A2N3PMI3_9PROT|nr:glycosyltransferase family 9 protein [Telmatospirillum siberiense]PKU21605.1 ADP-heptose--LPS heptosyltransferase [Telmatospirillum siberiense]
MVDQPLSVLVYVGLDLVGDGLMKLPFLRALRAAFPSARITWLAGQGKTVYAGALAPLIEGLVDEVIEDAHIGNRWWELLLPRPLKGRRFDLVLDSQRRVLTTLIVKRIRHGRFLSASADWHLSDQCPAAGMAKQSSMIRQMLTLVELASGRPALPNAPLRLDDRMETEAERRLPDGPVYVGLAPGAGGKHKCWPLENYIALAMRQVKAGRVPVVFLGPAERQWEDEIRDAVPGALLPLDYAATPLLTIALARRLAVAVANDSGTGHMMATAEVPLISLFGPTSPDKFAPVTPHLTILRAQSFGDSGMEFIPLSAVADAIETALGNIQPQG